MTHEVAPQDRFKELYTAKMGIKEVPTKINGVVHCSNEALLKEVDVTSGYRNQISWSN